MASRELALKLLDLAEPLVDQLVEHDPAARNAIYEALDAGTGYVASPGFDEKWRLTAAIRASDSRTLHRPIVGVLAAGTPDIGCSCASYGFCPHVAMLLVDVAANAQLRAALQKGETTATLLETIEPARKAFRERFDRGRILRNWLPAEAKRVDGPYEVQLTVEVVDTAVAIAPECVLELRVRPESGRVMLDPDDLSTTRLSEPMNTALRLCQPLTRGRKGFAVKGANASLVLHLLFDSRFINESDSRPITWAKKPLRLQIDKTRWSSEALRKLAAGAKARDSALLTEDVELMDALEARWKSADQSINRSTSELVVIQGAFPFLWDNTTLTFYRVAEGVDIETVLKMQRRPAIPLPVGDPVEFYKTLRERTKVRQVALPAPESFGLPAREKPQIIARFGGAPLSVTVELEARYRLDFLRIGPVLPEDPATWRDVDLEQSAARCVAKTGMVWDPGVSMFRAEGDAAAKLWSEGINALREETEPLIEVQVPASLAPAEKRKRVQTRVRIGMDGDWIRGKVRFDAGDTSVDLGKLRAALAGGAKWVALDDGSLAEITRDVSDAVRELEDVADASGAVEITRLHVGRAERLAALDPTADVDSALRALRDSIRTMAVREPKLPVGLRATLRDYQKAGIGWLQFLTELRAGGILADDMGLGKTLTTLALIQWRKEQEGTKPTLVVAPTSVLANWLREAARFTPELRTVLLHGDRRNERHALARRSDLVITSYGVLRSDIEILSAIDWRIVAVDEAQTIKNAGSSTSECARRLRAETRLALSGTPVENRLAELWAIMDFANPGLLGTLREFENRYEAPITHDGDPLAAARLRAVVRPFVLRRTKREVLTELPPKEEVARVLSLSPGQRKMYDAMAAILRDEIGGEVRSKGVGRSAFHVLTALLRLRQMACDPRLIDPAADPALSAKREVFLELARQLQAEGRRALVFSGFRQLLELWRGDLEKEKISFEYLDGTTTDRDARVHRFQNGTATLFLISLKAGGTGLNLTAADTVIHIDPWWNPAVEEQATDRAHRMGQSRSVTVYRLIAEGTVEEKITLLKARKKDLADAVVREDQGALRGLDESDVRMLLGEIGEVGDAPDRIEYPEATTSTPPLAPDAEVPADAHVAVGAIASKTPERPSAAVTPDVAVSPKTEHRDEVVTALASTDFAADRTDKVPSTPPVVETPSRAADPTPAPASVKRVAAAPLVEGEFVSGALVERAQASATQYATRTGASAKEIAARIGWNAGHLTQLMAGKKKYIPASAAAALIALDKER
jgi:superfamily II DNA or RNA helicase